MQELINLVAQAGYSDIEFYSKQRCNNGDEILFRARCNKTNALREVTTKNMQIISVS